MKADELEHGPCPLQWGTGSTTRFLVSGRLLANLLLSLADRCKALRSLFRADGVLPLIGTMLLVHSATSASILCEVMSSRKLHHQMREDKPIGKTNGLSAWNRFRRRGLRQTAI